MLRKRSTTFSYQLTSIVSILIFTACAPVGIVQEMENEFGTYQLYVPDSYTHEESSVVVIVHGTPGENEDVVDLAETFISRWTDFADSTGAIIVSPAFDQDNFASVSGAGGGYRGLYGRDVGADEFLHHILDDVGLALAPTTESRFYLYGHSAGGQFANRYVVRHPDRVLGVVLSAPGRYAFPDEAAVWANGMGGVEAEITWPGGERQEIDITPDPEGWVSATGLPVTVLVGDEDTDPQPCRPGHCPNGVSEATRIEIGERWVEKMQALAATDGRYGMIRMELVPGIGHNSAALTADAQEILRNLMADRVAVPDITGMTRQESMNALESVSLKGRTGESMLSDRPRGEVIMQFPEADSWRGRGSIVTFNISLGVEPPPDRTTVPDVVSKHSSLAREVIRAAGFTPRLQFVDSNLPFQTVVGQTPEGGDRAAPESEVRIFVSRGPGDIP